MGVVSVAMLRSLGLPVLGMMEFGDCGLGFASPEPVGLNPNTRRKKPPGLLGHQPQCEKQNQMAGWHRGLRSFGGVV